VKDDGGGIPLDKIRDRAVKMGLDSQLLAAASKQDLLSLIFEPGFSTASAVTDLSGRGVGMDVVRSKLKEIRGDVQVDTEAGVGTTFTLSIPFTLSVTRVLIIESRNMRMAFPVDAVEEMFNLPPEQVFSAGGKDSFEWNGQLLELVRLSEWLNFNCPVSLESPEIPPSISSPTVLVVQYNQRLVGIQIDRSWGEQEVALRRVVGNLPMPVGFNSCTILGDGHVVPLVAVAELLYWIASCEASGATPAIDPALPTYLPVGTESDSGAGLSRKPTVLLVDDSINVRRFIALTLEKAGYQVAQAKDGQDALDKLTAGLAVEAIICDVEMPRLDGYGFLSRIKEKNEYQQIPVAMLTSRGSPKHRQMAMNLGASAYFTKPYNEQTLLQTLEDLIEPALVS
jgi:chemosensory pili system protein ChpA (sensor histidine kinase/response regulator)